MFESRISASATEKSHGREKLHTKTVAWSYDMEGHLKNALRGIANCGFARKRGAIVQSFNPLLGLSQLQGGV